MKSLCQKLIPVRKITLFLSAILRLLSIIILPYHVKFVLLKNPILIPIIMSVIHAPKMLPFMILKLVLASSALKGKLTIRQQADARRIHKNFNPLLFNLKLKLRTQLKFQMKLKKKTLLVKQTHQQPIYLQII